MQDCEKKRGKQKTKMRRIESSRSWDFSIYIDRACTCAGVFLSDVAQTEILTKQTKQRMNLLHMNKSI